MNVWVPRMLWVIVLPLVDKVPADKNVTAGWVAFVGFILLILAVALLGKSLVTQLRKVDKAAEEGKYDPSDAKK